MDSFTPVTVWTLVGRIRDYEPGLVEKIISFIPELNPFRFKGTDERGNQITIVWIDGVVHIISETLGIPSHAIRITYDDDFTLSYGSTRDNGNKIGYGPFTTGIPFTYNFDSVPSGILYLLGDDCPITADSKHRACRRKLIKSDMEDFHTYVEEYQNTAAGKIAKKLLSKAFDLFITLPNVPFNELSYYAAQKIISAIQTRPEMIFSYEKGKDFEFGNVNLANCSVCDNCMDDTTHQYSHPSEYQCDSCRQNAESRCIHCHKRFSTTEMSSTCDCYCNTFCSECPRCHNVICFQGF